MRTTTLRSSISSFGPFCSNGSEPRSVIFAAVAAVYPSQYLYSLLHSYFIPVHDLTFVLNTRAL